MREETVTYKVYTFEELDPKVQSKVLDKFRDFNVDYDGWWEFVYEQANEKLNSIGFEDTKIWFTGFCSQGDGACFDGSPDIEKLIAHLGGKFLKLNRVIDRLSGEIDTIGHHYCHERTRRFMLSANINIDRCKRIGKLIQEFEDAVEELRYDLSHEIYKDLEQEYEYLTSDEMIKESLECNDYEFLSNGEIFHG